MPKVQVLVTITAEAVVEVPPHVGDVEAYLREHVTLEWGGLGVDRVVQEPSVTAAHFPLEEPATAEAAPEPAPEPAEEEPTGPLVDAARAIGSTLGKVAHAIGGLTGETAEEEAPAEEQEAVEEAAAAEEPVPEWNRPVAAWKEAVDEELEREPEPAAEPSFAAESVLAAAFAPEPGRELTSDEALSLFTDPVYKDMIRAAVRDRAAALLEGVVSEVVADLMPLLRRHLERHQSPGV